MAKKHKHEEHENHERWLVSYADFITLLFAFFVVMYAVSRVDMKKADQVSKSVRFAMHFEGTGGVGAMPIFDGPPSEGGCVANTGSGPRNSPEQKQQILNMRKRFERRLRPMLQDRVTDNAVKMSAENGKLSIRLAASRFFDPSQAALRPEMLPVLDAIAAELLTLTYPVRVEGHTDASPLKGERFRNNWELSAERAVTVVTYLEETHNVDRARLSAVGYGDTRPLSADPSPQAQEENRRIEIVLEMSSSDTGAYPVR